MSSPFDGMGGMGALLGGFQQKMEDMKKKAAATEVEGNAGGLVRVKMSCDFTVSSVTIDPKAMGDREMLEDLVRAATGDAVTKAKEEMARQVQGLMGGLPIPPGLLGF